MNRRGAETQRENLINPKFTKTVKSKATYLSSPNVLIGDMVSIKTGFPINHPRLKLRGQAFGNDNKGGCCLTNELINNGSASFYYKSPCPKLLKSPNEVLGIPILKDLPRFIITLFQKFSASPRLCGKLSINQKGASIIAVVAAMLILGVMGVTLISLVTTGSDVSINQLQSEKAFNIAAGGIEYTLGKNKSNIPNYSTSGAWIDLGDGEFKVDTPAYLNGNLTAGATTIDVVFDPTAAFPPIGCIVIDSELITYTGKNATQFTGTFRNTTTATTHINGNSVYPAARFSAITAVNCNPRPTIDVADDTEGFEINPPLNKYPFFIENEYFLCDTKTQYQFQSCRRCYAGSSPAAHPANSPYNRYAAQYILTSTGRITNILSNNAQRIVRVSVGPKEE